MNNKEIFYFSGRCLMLDEFPEFSETIKDKIEAEIPDWEKIVSFWSNHLILPAIYLKFERHNLIGRLPNELAEFLKEIYDLNLNRNKQILKQITDITSILNKGNIFPLYLKGAAHLLDNLYSDIGERILGDIDFLVPEKDYLPAARLLKNDGYAAFDENNYFDPVISKHYPRLSKQGFPANIEIHRMITEVHLRWFNSEIMDQQKKPVKLIPGCFVPADQHQVIHNFVHSQISSGGHFYLTISLRDLYDLHLLSIKSPVQNTLSQIQMKQRASAYFSLAESAMGLTPQHYNNAKLAVRLFKIRHSLNFTSPAFFYINRLLAFLRYKIVERYYVQSIGFIRSKKMRQAVIKRLTDPKWHKERVQEFSNIFLPNRKK